MGEPIRCKRLKACQSPRWSCRWRWRPRWWQQSCWSCIRLDMSCNNRSPKTEQGRNLFMCSHCNSRQSAGSRQTTTRCARCRPCIRSHILLPGPLPDNGSIIFPLYLTASNAGKSKCELGLHFERPLHRRRPIASLPLSLLLSLPPSLGLPSTSSFRTCRTIFRP